MKKRSQPYCYIIAGPNGAGKTTFAMSYLPLMASCHDFINADEIAKGLSPLDYNAGLMQAGRIFLDNLNMRIEARQDFAFETTLAGSSYLQKIPKWREAGWKILLFYLYIPSADFSLARVQQRVLQGGHGVQEVDVFRRFPRSIHNLFTCIEICDQTICMDNSGPYPIPIFEKRIGQTVKIMDAQRFANLQGALNK